MKTIQKQQQSKRKNNFKKYYIGSFGMIFVILGVCFSIFTYPLFNEIEFALFIKNLPEFSFIIYIATIIVLVSIGILGLLAPSTESKIFISLVIFLITNSTQLLSLLLLCFGWSSLAEYIILKDTESPLLN